LVFWAGGEVEFKIMDQLVGMVSVGGSILELTHVGGKVSD